MFKMLSRLLLVVLTVGAVTFPTLFPKELEKHEWPFVATTVGLAVAAVLLQREYDSREARKNRRLSHKLALQEGRSDTLKFMIKILTDPILLIEQDHDWTQEEEEKGVAKLNAAMTQILRALTQDVSDMLMKSRTLA